MDPENPGNSSGFKAVETTANPSYPILPFIPAGPKSIPVWLLPLVFLLAAGSPKLSWPCAGFGGVLHHDQVHKALHESQLQQISAVITLVTKSSYCVKDIKKFSLFTAVTLKQCKITPHR